LIRAFVSSISFRKLALRPTGLRNQCDHAFAAHPYSRSHRLAAAFRKAF
jgi:hypothetical protein